MITLCETIHSPDGHRPTEALLLDAWFELNYRLQEEATDTQINKNFIEQWLKRTIASPRPECFWLFLARINELALVCASRYVDCCEFAAADEFLPVPGSIPLDDEAERTVVSVDAEGRTGRGRKRFRVEKNTGPLLPCLYGLLKGSDYMTEDYLLSVFRRTEKIAQVVEMLSGLGMDKKQNMSIRLSCMDVHQRNNFRSRLCRFDRKIFNELGRALHLFMHTGNVAERYVGKYLRG
jgi:hypothetical protein